MEKKRILASVDIDLEIFLTSFDKTAKLLLEQKEKLEKEGWTSLHFTLDSYGDLIVKGMRLETDFEYNKRIAEEQKKALADQKKAERERKQYEKLKQKYG